MSQALKGSIPPVITPFSDNEIDLASYKKLIEFHIEEGSHGILVNGTSAEPSTLTVKERNQLVDVAIVRQTSPFLLSQLPDHNHCSKPKR